MAQTAAASGEVGVTERVVSGPGFRPVLIIVCYKKEHERKRCATIIISDRKS